MAMTAEQMEKEIKTIKELISEIHAAVVLGIGANPGKYEYEKAVKAFRRGDKGPISVYLEKGGIVPKFEGKKR